MGLTVTATLKCSASVGVSPDRVTTCVTCFASTLAVRTHFCAHVCMHFCTHVCTHNAWLHSVHAHVYTLADTHGSLKMPIQMSMPVRIYACADECTCLHKLMRSEESFRKQLKVDSITKCNHFFVCTHSQTCRTYKNEHCRSEEKLLKTLQDQGTKVETC